VPPGEIMDISCTLVRRLMVNGGAGSEPCGDIARVTEKRFSIEKMYFILFVSDRSDFAMAVLIVQLRDLLGNTQKALLSFMVRIDACNWVGSASIIVLPFIDHHAHESS
jgi:hypothetical protein